MKKGANPGSTAEIGLVHSQAVTLFSQAIACAFCYERFFEGIRENLLLAGFPIPKSQIDGRVDGRPIGRAG